MKRLSHVAKWRHLRHIRRRRRKALKRKVILELRRKHHLLYYANFESDVLAFCRQYLRGRNIARRGGDTQFISIPKVFSFLDAPEDVLDVLYSIVQGPSRQKCRQLFFDHRNCVEMDLGASIVMDVLAMEIRREWRIQKKARSIRGWFPKSQDVKELLEVTGIVRHLDIAPKDKRTSSKFLHFPLYIGRVTAAKPMESADTEQASSELADYFNACLATQNHSLTMAGFRHLAHMTGEILANAQEHSDSKKWYIIGYLRQAPGAKVGECNLSILSFGRTIFDTLNDATSEQLKSELNTLSDLHEKAGFFSQTWTKENLWTLYSLQEGVTRFRGTEKGKDRGMGTVKMIDFFQRLGQTAESGRVPRMCVLSGSTIILFDDKYRLKTETFGQEQRQVIAFNSENDLFRKPNKNNVKCVKGYFPGTLISMRFFLDGEFLSGSIQ